MINDKNFLPSLKNIFLCITMVVVSLVFLSCPQPDTPVVEDPYRAYDIVIKTKQDLISFRNRVNSGDEEARSAHVILANNISLKGENWEPIGTWENPFNGIFEGNNNRVYDLTHNDRNSNNIALFGMVFKGNGIDTEIKNLTLWDVNITANNDIAALAVRTRPGVKITNIQVINAVIDGNVRVGSLVAYLQGGEIDNCHSNSHIIGDSLVGGLVGQASYKLDSSFWWKARISNSTSKGIVDAYNTTAASRTGGILGYAEFAVTIENCTNYSEIVSRGGRVAGILGDGESVRMTGCSNYATIHGAHENAAGIVGYMGKDHDEDSFIKNSTNSANVMGDNYRVGGILGTAVGQIGDIHIENVVNTGNITATGLNPVGAGALLLGDYVGGIAGYGGATIENATNTGIVSTVNRRSVDIGQIVGGNIDSSGQNLTAPLIEAGEVIRLN